MKKAGESSAIIRDLILGGQDGLVNVLGIVLAVAEATSSKYVILIAGLAATFAESISMAAVAYTSAKAGREYYAKERKHIQSLVKQGKAKPLVKKTLQESGFQGTFLNNAIQYMMRSKDRASKLLLKDGLQQEVEFKRPVRDAIVVGFAAVFGSLIPLAPFFIFPIPFAIVFTLGISTLTLFISGAIKAKYTAANPWKSGIEMALVGMTAAIAGYLIGKALGVIPI